MTVPNFMSKAFSYQDLRRVGTMCQSRSMIRQKYLGADRVNIILQFFISNLIINCVISFYILSNRFFLTRKVLSDATVASITKKEYGFAMNFLKDSKCL